MLSISPLVIKYLLNDQTKTTIPAIHKIRALISRGNELNVSKKLEPIAFTEDNKQVFEDHTIVEFIGPDSIRLGNFAPRWRVRNISFERNKSIILKRNKSK